MGNSEYWTSLWVVGLIIVLCFFGLALGSQVFVFLAEKISAFEIWNSPLWLKLKIPLIVLGVICFLVAVVALSRNQGQREMKAARDYAETQGWGFSRDDTEGLTAKVSELLPDYKFNLRHIRTVETGRRNLVLFDCSYRHRDSNSRNDSRGTACLVQSDRFRSIAAPVEIAGREWTEVMLSDKVDMGNSPFAEQFLVQSQDPGPARRVISESIQAILLEHAGKPLSNPVSVIIGPGGAVMLTRQTDQPELLQDVLDLARKLESAAH